MVKNGIGKRSTIKWTFCQALPGDGKKNEFEWRNLNVDEASSVS